MSMVCGLDLHRRQITFDALEVETGQVWTGRVWQPDRERLRRWLREDVAARAKGGSVAFAVEGCTGWRYVVEEVLAAGFEVYLAVDACGARHAIDHEAALRRLESAGVNLSTTETAMFEWCRTAGTAEFKKISALVKSASPE